MQALQKSTLRKLTINQNVNNNQKGHDRAQMYEQNTPLKRFICSRDILKKYSENCVTIPMKEDLRSLNLSNSVAIGAYEAIRQFGGIE